MNIRISDGTSLSLSEHQALFHKFLQLYRDGMQLSFLRAVPVEVHTQVPVSGEEALVHIVKLVVILHQQLQAGLITAGSAHGLKHNTHKWNQQITSRCFQTSLVC